MKIKYSWLSIDGKHTHDIKCDGCNKKCMSKHLTTEAILLDVSDATEGQYKSIVSSNKHCIRRLGKQGEVIKLCPNCFKACSILNEFDEVPESLVYFIEINDVVEGKDAKTKKRETGNENY